MWNESWNGWPFRVYLPSMAKTRKGHVEQLPSGSLRVKVYTGTDPVTGKPRQLRETCADLCVPKIYATRRYS